MGRVFGSTMKFLASNWERAFFALVGSALLLYSFDYLRAGKVTEASVVFAIAFFSFLYSNLSRFKHFKGLGFEAELWEDKQKEAADLIDRLKSVVAIYTREVVMTKVMSGRWNDGAGDWAKRWKLFDELVTEHTALGQKIDFSDLKKSVDRVFLFDICSGAANTLMVKVDHAKREARKTLAEYISFPMKQNEEYKTRLSELEQINFAPKDLFERSERHNIAKECLDLFLRAQSDLKEKFGVDVETPDEALQRLKKLAALYDNQPVVVTPELVAWAEEH